ncbi:MAG: hypothetical protein GF344_16600 [Chitinivibrionales bacterium]|nr:hypothetical protein [Chitinivibrionales bacterium]MBD3358311.1 hypothetical protein [Chitinivibrionales bacterium]
MVGLTWCGAASYRNRVSRKEGLNFCYDETDWTSNFSADGYRPSTDA